MSCKGGNNDNNKTLLLTIKFSLHTPFHFHFNPALPLSGVCDENVVERNRITSTSIMGITFKLVKNTHSFDNFHDIRVIHHLSATKGEYWKKFRRLKID